MQSGEDPCRGQGARAPDAPLAAAENMTPLQQGRA